MSLVHLNSKKRRKVKPELLLLCLVMITITLLNCKQMTEQYLTTNIDSVLTRKDTLPLAIEPGQGYDFENNGKEQNVSIQKNLYIKDDSFESLLLSREQILKAARSSKQYLKKTSSQEPQLLGNMKVTHHELSDVVDLLISAEELPEIDLTSHFDLFRIEGEDQRSNVHYTSYFIPVIKVNDTHNSTYTHPIYQKPPFWQGRLPTRKAIEKDSALEGKNLVLAYASDLLALYMMQVQGSGYVQFLDGSTQLLSYGGQNGHAYSSLGQYLVGRGYISKEDISLDNIKAYFNHNPDSLMPTLWQNKSYTFFVKGKNYPVGAANTPLVAGYSIAIDRRYIPLGATLLGKVPVLNEKGTLIRHEYKLLFAHDVGGAIKGPGHVDVYSGVGSEGENAAGALHHYGKLWLLLPKKVANN